MGSEPRTWVLVAELRKPPMTANEQRRATWRTMRAAKYEAGQLVWALAKRARVPRLRRARVDVVWHAPTRTRRDADALGPFLKATLDGLVQAGVLGDDDYRHVPRVGLGVEIDRARPRIEITITELGAPE
ncbi:hypothetical protein [Tomitella gaofuii]|uniref:hypothetical protein n=1 Tax=Tomitella gaofuii TaxID=2760083 RepID=UPI0015F9BA28|nr:hypothetical protein [Tomitella gaofuii]